MVLRGGGRGGGGGGNTITTNRGEKVVSEGEEMRCGQVAFYRKGQPWTGEEQESAVARTFKDQLDYPVSIQHVFVMMSSYWLVQ